MRFAALALVVTAGACSSAKGAQQAPTPQPATGDAGAMGECVSVQDKLLSELLRHPERFYVNLHTSAFPNGSTRGQLKVQKR